MTPQSLKWRDKLRALLLANGALPTNPIGCLWVGPDPCRASETLGGEISGEAASERRGPLPVMLSLLLTCTRHLNSHWFGEGNIWEGPHQSKGSAGRSCQKPRGARAAQKSRGGGGKKSQRLPLSPSSPGNCNDPFHFLMRHVWEPRGAFGESAWRGGAPGQPQTAARWFTHSDHIHRHVCCACTCRYICAVYLL